MTTQEIKIRYYNKIARCILSCKTKSQLRNCVNFPTIFWNKFKDKYRTGKLMGYLELRKNQLIGTYIDAK